MMCLHRSAMLSRKRFFEAGTLRILSRLGPLPRLTLFTSLFSRFLMDSTPTRDRTSSVASPSMYMGDSIRAASPSTARSHQEVVQMVRIWLGHSVLHRQSTGFQHGRGIWDEIL